MIGFYTVQGLQTITSGVMLCLVYREKAYKLQSFVGFIYARAFDYLYLNFTMLFFFKFLFSLKRVQIQMNENNITLAQSIQALKKYYYAERTVLTLLTISILIFMGGLSFLTSQVEEGLPDYSDEEKNRLFRIFLFQLLYYITVFTSDLCIITYFLNMTRNYVAVLGQYYQLKPTKFFIFLGLFTCLLVLTLFRWDIYITTLLVLKFYYGDRDETFDSYREGPFSRFLIYLSKFTPFLIVMLVQGVLQFFAEKDGDQIDELSSSYDDDDGVNSGDDKTNYDGNVVGMKSIRGSIETEAQFGGGEGPNPQFAVYE